MTRAVPTLVDPAVVRAHDAGLAGAVVWQLEFVRDAGHLVLPDLSCDLVWGDGEPTVTPRTTTRLTMPARRGQVAAGLRLPPDAAGLVIDPAWPGWRLDDPRDPAERAERLAVAVQTGALVWRSDDGRDRLLRLLDQPGVRLDEVSAATGWSPSSLHRTCRRWFGASPGAVVQVLRLWRFVRASAGTSLSTAAQEAGFADQQHACRSVRALSGMSPSAVAAWAAGL